ncbi:hypothetical protein [Streptoalloteichus hindustanus]|uniref:Uncharacterized protein n=1 Tax=Streptoalloteichus hindustanus TaxID=2017 RepID=A0A1M5F627_STRHI|nr:hypothetical protein [Streptoalloteichus hindustanus]SHF87070.1 hypothetical protein SAMN05444320_105292 [Streptoalloteichus hindustanus]
MNRDRVLAALGVGVFVVGSAFAAQSASAQPTPQSASGPSVKSDLTTGEDVVRQTTANVRLQPTGGTPATVLLVSLSPGSWVLSSNVTLVSWGPSDYTRCGLYVNEKGVGGAATMVGGPSPSGEPTGVYVATLSVHGAFTSGENTTVSLRCAHDHNRTASEAAYVDPGATLWAHRS